MTRAFRIKLNTFIQLSLVQDNFNFKSLVTVQVLTLLWFSERIVNGASVKLLPSTAYFLLGYNLCDTGERP